MSSVSRGARALNVIDLERWPRKAKCRSPVSVLDYPHTCPSIGISPVPLWQILVTEWESDINKAEIEFEISAGIQ